MGEYDGIKIEYIPQCNVCEHVNGKGCKAFNVSERARKYYDSRAKNFSKCDKFKLNRTAENAVQFMRLKKDYKWK